MKIKETLMSQSFSIINPDPYMFSLQVMETMSKDAKVVEKKNEYETDGPHHRSMVDFDTIELVDDFSKIVFHFELAGEGEMVHANVRGALISNIEETGFFSQTFVDYYVKTIFPLLRKISEDRIKFFGGRVEKLFSAS